MLKAEDWQRYSAKLDLQIPATVHDVEACERALELVFPLEYKEFLRKTNGAEGIVGEHSYAIFWRVSELAKFNEAYQVQRYAPGYLLFGSDGGGEAFAFDITKNMTIFTLPFVGMSRDVADGQGTTFWQFLEELWHQ